jgi:hypothetical protein
MNGKPIKVKVKREFKQLAEALPLGFETEIIPDLRDEDFVYYTRQTDHKTKVVTEQKNVIPKGDFIGYSFIGATGETYCDEWIYHNIGPGTLDEVFEKI